jgi:hypothetical protein
MDPGLRAILAVLGVLLVLGMAGIARRSSPRGEIGFRLAGTGDESAARLRCHDGDISGNARSGVVWQPLVESGCGELLGEHL